MRSKIQRIQEYEILQIYRGLEEEWEQEASLIAMNQRAAVEIAKGLSRAMQHGTVETSKISDLKRINPYACSDPLAIAQLLLENLNTQALWNYYQYSDERACITKLIRRYLLAYLLRKRKKAGFNKEFIDDVHRILDPVMETIRFQKIIQKCVLKLRWRLLSALLKAHVMF